MLNAMGFQSFNELVKFINTNGVTKTNIQDIEFGSGIWVLFYWTT